ncbi:MAG: hypothetical protein RLZZ400_872 [Actinomycetota bacterium]
MLTSLFLAPFLVASQSISDSHLRKLAVEATAGQLSRQLSLNPSQDPTALASLLQEDAEVGQMSFEYWCMPEPRCSDKSSTVTVRVHVGETRALATSLVSDEGSVLLPLLGVFALAFGLLLASTNLQVARVVDFKAGQAAELLAMSSYRSSSVGQVLAQPETEALLAGQLNPADSRISVDSYEVKWIDNSTVQSVVCLRYPIFQALLTRVEQSTACAIAKVRDVAASSVFRNETRDVPPHQERTNQTQGPE